MLNMIKFPAIVVLLMLAADAQAIFFSFEWHGDPSKDSNIVSSSDHSLRARGVIEIDALAGATFSRDDITRTEIHITGIQIDNFVIRSWTEAGGVIGADGQTATFTADGNPYSNEADQRFFGCRHPGCGNKFGIDITRTLGPLSEPLEQVLYASQSSALASMRISAAPVPLPPVLGTFALLAVSLFVPTKRSKNRHRA